MTLRAPRLLLAALVVGVGWACNDTIVSVIRVDVVEIEPGSVSAFVHDAVQLEARIEDAAGNRLSGREVLWSSDSTGVASVDEAGLVVGIAPGSTTIAAMSEGVRGTAQVTILARPAIQLDSDSVGLAAVLDQDLSASTTIAVTNAGNGTLSGLAASVAYDDGVTDWLEADLSADSAPATLTLTAYTDGLEPGTYTATVAVGAANASNGAQEVRLSFEVIRHNPVPSLTGVSPASAQRESTLTVELTGNNFFPDLTTVSFGTRIVINSLSFDSPQRITASITVERAAALGPRAVLVINAEPGGGIAVLADGFTVEGENPFPTLEWLEPASGQRLASLDVAMEGSGFLEEITTVDFGHAIQINSVTVTSDTTLVANISIGANAAAGLRSVSVANPSPGGGIATKPDAFLVEGENPAPTLESVEPGSGGRLHTLDVVLTGTEFAPGMTSASFGDDITINEFTVTSSQSATATISIDSTAALGPRAVQVINAPPGGGSVTLEAAFSVVVGDASASASSVSATNDPVVADGVAAGFVTVQPRDAGGGAITALAPGAFEVSATGSAGAGAVSETDTPGEYTVAITNTVAETVVITVTVDGVDLDDRPSVAFVAGPVSGTESSVSAQPTTGVAADGNSAATVTVQLRDTQQNPISGVVPSAFEVSVSGSGVAGVVTETATPGRYTFGVSNEVAEAVTITVAVTGTTLAQQPQVEFTADGISASVSTVTAEPAAGVTADGVTTSTVTVMLRDPNANPIGGLTSADFDLVVSGSAVASAVVETETEGTYTFAVTDTVAESVTVTVSADGVALTQQPTIEFVAGSVSASNSGVTAEPAAGVAADGVEASTVTVTLRDAFDNVVGGLTEADFSIMLTGSAVRDDVSETGSAGVYTFTLTNTVAETVTVTVAAAGVTLADQPSIGFIANEVSATLSDVTADPTVDVVADSVTASTVTVLLRDGNDNPVAGMEPGAFQVEVVPSGDASAVTETETPGTYTFTVTNTKAETVTVRVTVGGVELEEIATIAFVPGDVSASVSTVTADPVDNVAADGVAASTVTVTLRDAHGNPIGGLAAGEFAVQVSGSGVASAVSATVTAGVYTFDVTNGTAETVTVTVTARGVELADKPTIGFVSGDVSASQSQVTADPTGGVAADGTDASTVTVLLRNETDDPIAGVAPEAFDAVVAPSGSASAVIETSPGTYTFTVTNTKADTVTVTVTVGGLQLEDEPTIEFVPGDVSASASTVTADPVDNIAADGVAASNVTITLRDAQTNPIGGVAGGEFAVQVSGSGVASAVSETVTAGVYTFDVTNDTAETVTVTVIARGVELDDKPTIGFIAGEVSATLSQVTAEPTGGLTAGGETPSTVTVMLRDANTNPVAGLTDADFEISVTQAGTPSAVAETTTPGTYTFTVTSPVADTVTVTVTAAGVQLIEQPEIVFVAVSAATSEVTAHPVENVVADGTDSSTVTVVLRDANAQPVAGLAPEALIIAVAPSGSASAIAETETPGTYTFAVTNTVAETVTVTVTADGVQLANEPEIAFVADAVSATESTVTADPIDNVVADGTQTSTVTVLLRDANDNPVAGLAPEAFIVVVAPSGSASAVMETATPGTYTFTVANTETVTVIVVVTADGVQLEDKPEIAFVPGPVDPGASTVVAAQTSAPKGTAVPVTVTLVDASGRPIAGLTNDRFAISLQPNGTRSPVAETATPGTYVFTVTNNAAVTVTVSVTADGVLLIQQPQIKFDP